MHNDNWAFTELWKRTGFCDTQERLSPGLLTGFPSLIKFKQKGHHFDTISEIQRELHMVFDIFKKPDFLLGSSPAV